jgi:hypothetical protein
VPTAYQRYNGQNGLQLADGLLRAYDDGQLVGEVACTDTDLDQLLGQYRVPPLLPTLSFVHPPEQHLHLSISLDFSEPGEVMGSMELNGVRQLWRARRTHSALFTTPLPAGARPWVSETEPDAGWELWLPLAVMRDPDPVITRRVALVTEAFLYRLLKEERLVLPFTTTINNVFRGQDIWLENLPRVVTLVERYLRDEN